jgi:hypothetical protein
MWRLRAWKSRSALLADRKKSYSFLFGGCYFITLELLWSNKTNENGTKNSWEAEATEMYDKYICTKDQCFPLKNSRLRMRKFVAYWDSYVTGVYLTLET